MDDHALLEATLRSLGAAWRASRLYPVDSPMTAEAAARVSAAAQEYMAAEPSIRLEVVRGGFVLRGIDGVLTAPGVPELADAFGEHGIGELHLTAPPEPAEVVSLLGAAQERPHELHEKGGMQSALDKAGVASIRVVSLVLTKVEAPPEIPEDEADKFLAELAADAGRLAVWLRSLLGSDDEALAEGILVLADAAGEVKAFGRTMAAAFLELDTLEQDRLLEASISLDPVRHVMVEMIANLSELEIVAALRGGRYGDNMLAFSYALTSLPMGDRSDYLVREAIQALGAADIEQAKVEFLERMVATRRSQQPPTSMSDTHPEFNLIHEAATKALAATPTFRDEARSRMRLDPITATEILTILDLADDLTAYAHTLGAIARAIPGLLADDPKLAMWVLEQISERSSSSDHAWPGLAEQFTHAMETACGKESMSSLLELYAKDENAVEIAKSLVSLGGEPAVQGLATAILESKAEDGIDFGLAVIGRRLPELLAVDASTVEPRHAAKLAELFSRDGGPNCMRALGQMVARPESQVRTKTARGILAAGGGQALTAYMPKLLRDESSATAVVVAAAIGGSGVQGGTEVLAARFRELEGDEDVPLAREIVKHLVSSPSPVAQSALEEVASKGGFLKKGKYAEIKRLAHEALDARARRGGG